MHPRLCAQYRGYSTVVIGTLPIRGLYLTTLELVKARARSWDAPAALPEALRTGAADFVAGAVASCVTQCLVVPVDVVSQRLMVQQGSAQGGAAGSRTDVLYRNGWAAARGIVATEGMAGLYRGAGASLAIFVPSSGVWWGSYGAYQRCLWSLLASYRGADAAPPSAADVVPVQTFAALCAGATSGLLTTPLDVVKTRLQTAPFEPGRAPPTFRSIAAKV
jgi:solute carrier family 25 protein 44